MEELRRWEADPANIEVAGPDDIADFIAKGRDPRDLHPYGPADADVYDLAQEIIEALHIETKRDLGMALLRTCAGTA